jgi:hypothetical protein
MPDSSHDDRLLAWGLGTFHTSLFVLTLVMFLFLRGGLGGLLAVGSTPWLVLPFLAPCGLAPLGAPGVP